METWGGLVGQLRLLPMVGVVRKAFLFGWLASWLDLHLIGVRKSLVVSEKRV
jgi:hypothetical protein